MPKEMEKDLRAEALKIGLTGEYQDLYGAINPNKNKEKMANFQYGIVRA